ncbi:thyrostimulin alpha-2 subunit [Drosophila madeirensis]|uniref:Blast:Carnitine O-acetyltransferase n=2 Tax=obscura subgroup TaxID=32357 RepID=A0A3B0JTX5_DROGU|nr:thyrostimulin alpha-2 subunit [Drosophila guanche]XP_034666290.1 thyrostimulin alpha-2 subunit [Drosophila subobscura]SPP85555.1 blast:Carnitine O-acetyltransferase [Drosophila guanche]
MWSTQWLVLLCCSFWFLPGECSLAGKDVWLRPGCHKVGNTRKISIPDCVEFTITTNACRGFCESYSVPSIPWAGASLTGLFKPPKPVVSVGQCCNMMKSEEIQRRVLCIEGIRNVTFKSAVSCSCYHCKKD